VPGIVFQPGYKTPNYGCKELNRCDQECEQKSGELSLLDSPAVCLVGI
jgi:hypothetical protein